MTEQKIEDAINAGLNLLDKDRSEPYTFLVRAFSGLPLAMTVEPVDNNAGVLLSIFEKSDLTGMDPVHGMNEIFNRMAEPSRRYKTMLGDVDSPGDGSHTQIISLVPLA